jgi:hypothetical protein
MDKCLVCGKDITYEIPNDWDADLCYNCAKKGMFKKNNKFLDEAQVTIFDSAQLAQRKH